MERAATETAMEHRWGKRMSCRASVRICAGIGISGAGRVRDISSSGAFIETPLVLAECTPVTLFICGNESAMREVEVGATVVRRESDGVGIEWCETPAGSVCAMAGCVTSCAALHSGAEPGGSKNRTPQSAAVLASSR